MFIRGEALSAHSARPRKIPGWIVVVREKFSVKIEIALSGFLSVFFSKFTFDFNGFHLKGSKIIQCDS